MPAPTAKVDCIQQTCKVVRDTKAAQTRGKAGSSLEGTENHQCSTSLPPVSPPLQLDPEKSQNRPLFWVLHNNLLQAMAEQEEQLDLTTCDSSVHRLRYRTGQAGVKGPCGSQTLLRRALSLLIKEGSVSSAPPSCDCRGLCYTYLRILPYLHPAGELKTDCPAWYHTLQVSKFRDLKPSDVACTQQFRRNQ